MIQSYVSFFSDAIATSSSGSAPMKITLPNDLYEMIKSLTDSGRYGSDIEVIEEGLRMLKVRERAMEKWIKDEVVPAHESLKRDPTQGMSVAEVRAAMEAWREGRPIDHIRRKDYK